MHCKEECKGRLSLLFFWVFVDSQQDEASLLFSIIMRLSEQLPNPASSQFLGQLDPIFWQSSYFCLPQKGNKVTRFHRDTSGADGNKVARFHKSDRFWCCNQLEEYILSQRNVSLHCAFPTLSQFSNCLYTLQNQRKWRPNNHSTQLLADPLLRKKFYTHRITISIVFRKYDT